MKKKLKFYSVLFLFFIAFQKIFCANQNFKSHLLTDSLLKKKNCCNSWCFGTSAKPLLSIVSYNSFLMNEKVKFTGIKLGAEIADKVRCGIGFYDLNKGVSLHPVIRDNDTLYRTAKFNYWNFFAEYVFYEDFRWELSIPVGIGKAVGKIDTVSSVPKSSAGSENINSMGILNAGFDSQYKVFPWLGIGAGIGFLNVFAPQYLQEKINAPSYSIKIKIFLGYLFKAIFLRKKLQEEKNAYLKEKENRKNNKKERRELRKNAANSSENFDKNNNDY